MFDTTLPKATTLPSSLRKAWGLLRAEFLSAANSYPEINLSMIRTDRMGARGLDGPPVELWRGDSPIVWSQDHTIADHTCRFAAWGDCDDRGAKRFERLIGTADRCMQSDSVDMLSTALTSYDPKLGWLGVLLTLASNNVTPMLLARRSTWDERQLYQLDDAGHVVLGTDRVMRDIFGDSADYSITTLDPDVFSASAYAIDYLLGGSDGAPPIVVVQQTGATAKSLQKSSKKKRRRPNRELTEKQLIAWDAYLRLGSSQAVADEMGISRQAADKHLARARAKTGRSSRSVSTQALASESSRRE